MILHPWKLQIIEPYCAKTTIRLWHELHVEKKISHDFVSMVSPSINKDVYFAAILYNDIRAIAECERSSPNCLQIKNIAHAPNQLDACQILVYLMSSDNIYMLNKNQPRWYLESLYLSYNYTENKF